jgi:hypothetical protein
MQSSISTELIDNDIYSFLISLESSNTTMYVPTNKITGEAIDQSGPTIATGIDIGQMDLNDLKYLNISQDLFNKLKPYVGLKKKDAVKFVKQNKLTISKEEVKELDKAYFTRHGKLLEKAYNAISKIKFLEIPHEARKVILSVGHQYGLGLNDVAPIFWGCVTKQNWIGAVNELRDFRDIYKTRRNKEADVLEKWLKNKINLYQ